MQVNLNGPSLVLEVGQVLSLDGAEGTRICTRTGTVWVTEEGSRKDNIVGAGDSFVLVHPGRAVVQALQQSWISIGDGPCAAHDAH